MLKATHNRNGYDKNIGRKTKRHFIGEYSGNGVAELKSDLGKFDFNRLKDYIGLGMSGGNKAEMASKIRALLREARQKLITMHGPERERLRLILNHYDNTLYDFNHNIDLTEEMPDEQLANLLEGLLHFTRKEGLIASGKSGGGLIDQLLGVKLGRGMSGGGMEDGLIPPEHYTKFATQSNQHRQSEGSGMSGGRCSKCGCKDCGVCTKTKCGCDRDCGGMNGCGGLRGYNPLGEPTLDELLDEMLRVAEFNETHGLDARNPEIHALFVGMLGDLINGVDMAPIPELQDYFQYYKDEIRRGSSGGSKKSQYLQHLLYKDQFDIQRPQEQYRPNLEKRDRYRREQPIAPMPMMEESIAAAAQVQRPVDEPLVPSLSRARSLERIRARAASERPQLNETQYTAQQEYRFESKPEPSYVLKEQPRPPPSFKSETKTASEEAVSRPRREVPDGKDEAMPKPVRRNTAVVARSIPRVDSLQIGDLLALVDRYDDYERTRDDYHGVYRVVGKKAKTYQVELIKETMPDTPAAISMNKAPESFSVSIKQNKRGKDYLNPIYAKGKGRGNYHAFMAIGRYDLFGNVQPIDPALFIQSKNSNFRFGTFIETNE